MQLQSLILLVQLLSAVSSTNIHCSYQVTATGIYTCTNTNLEINENAVKLDKVVGDHKPGKTDNDVTGIYFLSSAMRSLPRNIFGIFPELQRYIVHGIDVQGKHLNRKSLVQGDFHGGEKLNVILITGVNLNAIRANVFEGADNLFLLSLEACGITNVDKDAFTGLSKLRSLSLNYNLLKSLPVETFKSLESLKFLLVVGNFIEKLHKQHFENLKSLQKVSFISNMLKVIDEDIIENLTELTSFYLERNLCVSLNFGLSTKISEFKASVDKCKVENASGDANEQMDNLPMEIGEEVKGFQEDELMIDGIFDTTITRQKSLDGKRRSELPGREVQIIINYENPDEIYEEQVIDGEIVTVLKENSILAKGFTLNEKPKPNPDRRPNDEIEQDDE